MFIKRSVQEVLDSAMTSISENTPFQQMNAGSIARSIIEAMAPEIGSTGDTERASLYDFAQQVLEQGQVSKAKEENLELIGGLFSYPRRKEVTRQEDGTLVEDYISYDQYRYEITQICPSMATANYSAIRLELLTIQGVKDVVGKEYAFGTGSFAFLLEPMYGFNEKDVAAMMDEAMQKVKAYGVRAEVALQSNVPVDLTIRLAFHETVNDQEKDNTCFETQNKIHAYLGTLERGHGIIYNDLVQEIMNISDKIADFEITKFYMNNVPVLLMNQEISDDERVIPQNIEVI